MITDPSSWDWPELAAADIALLVSMAPLLLVMAFFSLIEATYFSLTPGERLGLKRSYPEAHRKVEQILGSPRVLLVSTMLGALIAGTAFLGAGLLFAGATGICAMATVLSKMPWNNSATPAASSTNCCAKAS